MQERHVPRETKSAPGKELLESCGRAAGLPASAVRLCDLHLKQP